MELLQLASAAAAGEGHGELLPEQLVQEGFLPENFGRRADFSGPIASSDHVMDSLRGSRGYFTPIPDIEIKAITESEAERLREQNDTVREEWRQMLPLVVSIQRDRLDRNGLERLSFSTNITSLLGKNTELLTSLLGSPTQYKHGISPTDVVNIHASISGGLLFKSVPQHQLFVSVQNEPAEPISVKPSGFFSYLQLLKGFPGYVGAWPKPGFLDTFTPQLARPDEKGFSYSRLLDLHRMQAGDYSILAFDKQRLIDLKPHLGAIKTESIGQIHANCGDLSSSRLSTFVDTLFYQRAIQASLGNIKLLNAMTQQMGVAPSEARSTVEKLIDGKLICSLKGDYKTIRHSNGRDYWTTTNLPPVDIRQVPEDYQSNFLKWFRGARLTLLADRGQVVISGHIDMQRDKTAAKESSKTVPSIPGLGNLFGSGKKKADEKKADRQKK